jgi:hypothetical protein
MKDQLQLLAGGRTTATPQRPTSRTPKRRREAAQLGLAEARAALEAARARADAHRIVRAPEHHLPRAG